MTYLTFIRFDGRASYGHKMALYKCICGNTKRIDIYAVRNGNTKSCGCANKRNPPRRTHGESRKTREYGVWEGMLRRCRPGVSESCAKYYGKGIRVCQRWLKFENFLADMGRCPLGFTIERKDSKGDYSPSNCKWACMKEQQNNRTNNRLITHSGITLTMMQWSEKTGIKYGVIFKRLKRGWTVEQALSTP